MSHIALAASLMYAGERRLAALLQKIGEEQAPSYAAAGLIGHTDGLQSMTRMLPT